jgi:hypothetical protein
MKPHKQPLRYSLIAVGLLLLATGFTISKIRTPPNRTENISRTSEIHQSSRSPHPTSSELHRTFTSIDTQLGPERLLRLIATIAGSNLDTLPDLANHFTNDGAALKLITLHWFNLTSWTTLHPEAAATWLTDHPNARIQDELRPSLLRAWSKKDPEAAHQYGLTNLTGFRQRQALRLIEPDEIPK